ncbi:hypothetical protein S40288_10983 [Stachybotrys chartarum IBT 40288]|nr:hypothetical protein S40288_10983 [Stachybotrys chartarum IBT 40288]
MSEILHPTVFGSPSNRTQMPPQGLGGRPRLDTGASRLMRSTPLDLANMTPPESPERLHAILNTSQALQGHSRSSGAPDQWLGQSILSHREVQERLEEFTAARDHGFPPASATYRDSSHILHDSQRALFEDDLDPGWNIPASMFDACHDPQYDQSLPINHPESTHPLTQESSLVYMSDYNCHQNIQEQSSRDSSDMVAYAGHSHLVSRQVTLSDIERTIEMSVFNTLPECVEDSVEHHIAGALGPFRLNVNRMKEATQNLDETNARLETSVRIMQQENAQLRNQNNTLARLIHLTYQTLENQTNMFNSRIMALEGMLQSHSGDMQVPSTSLYHLEKTNYISDMTNRIPTFVQDRTLYALQNQVEPVMQDSELAEQQGMSTNQPLIQQMQPFTENPYNPLLSLNDQHSATRLPHTSKLDNYWMGEALPSSAPGSPKVGFKNRIGKIFKQNGQY